ncbi:hypothetical protein BJP36_37635 [Moorena producens JHB]|uniref:Uncharacterized protein n=1 Tax=Moorena producens (strain JHB) TaxID=1454205 RepID=A0A9Q9SUD7_MOOP1|nr:hypothetical protein [Moorena producens]WAN69818.1 hypothetical protein BJP36_37635 [Moorena producens JHB]
MRLAIGHATRTHSASTFNLGQKATLREQPLTPFNLQHGHLGSLSSINP